MRHSRIDLEDSKNEPSKTSPCNEKCNETRCDGHTHKGVWVPFHVAGKLKAGPLEGGTIQRENTKMLTFIPNNPAIKAPVPIPMVPMDTFETELTFREK
jgi:hypothetical protein